MKKQFLLFIPALIGFTQLQAQETTTKKNSGITISDMDQKVKPSDNFYRFVNGAWLDKTQIPDDKTAWGSSDILFIKTEKDALNILKEAVNNPKYKPNTDQGKTITFYKSIIDTVSRNDQGIHPLKQYIAKIDAIKTTEDIQQLLMEMEPIGSIGFFTIGIGADDKNSNKNSVSLMPGKLGLPDKDYYSSDDKDSKEKRDKYVTHVARMLGFFEDASPEKNLENAKKVLAFETAMSAPRLDRVERRDSRKQYNPMTVAELQKMVPAINWNRYFTGLGLKNLDTVVVTQPRYMAGFANDFY